jgi:hypothetical protein
MKWLLLAGLLSCTPTPPVPPPVVVAPVGYPSCTGNVQISSADMCPSLFTTDGYPCARCRGRLTGGCLDSFTKVYCATGTCGDDSTCIPVDATAKRRTK